MPRLVVSCEHGGNRIPAGYAALFAGQAKLLRSHRGFDLGALPLARVLARRYGAPLFEVTISRLLIDLNRSLYHRAVFSAFSAQLDAAARRRLVARHYTPHRLAVQNAIAATPERAVHICVHSFTPVLHGVTRNADIGLLYDPRRAPERAFCAAWKRALVQASPALRVRFNYPYRGNADGFTTHLRKQFAPRRYLGIELEINQRLVTGKRWRHLQGVVCDSLVELL